MATNLLALDSSTDELAVAVCAGARQWGRVLAGGALASSRIIGLALEGLAECGIAVAQLDAVAFGAGPGAFTGLRCACAVAQGLAFGAGKPALAIDSLMLVAEDAREAGATDGAEGLWAAMDARMDEVYAAHYRFVAGGWQVIDPPALYTLEALAACWQAQPPRAVAGSAVTAFSGRLPWRDAVTVPHTRDRAAALLRLAHQAHAEGAAIDPALAVPVYLRDKVALTTLEREAVRREAGARRG